MTDGSLLERFVLEKSEETFRMFVERHIDLVYRTALRQLGGRARDADDITQEVFATAARKAARLAGHPNIVGWLYLATHHATASAIRKEAHRKAREEEAFAMNLLLEQPKNPEEIRQFLDGFVCRLRPRDQAVILLRYYEGRSFGEIAAQLGLKEDAARRRAERALQRLRLLAERRGIQSSMAALAAAFPSESAIAAPAQLASATVQHAISSAAPASSLSALSNGLLLAMTTTRTLVAVACFAVLIGGMALHEFREHQVAKSRLQDDVRVARQFHDRLQAEKTRLQSVLSIHANETVSSPSRPSSARARNAQWSPIDLQIAADPAGEAALLDQVMLQQSLLVGPSFKAYDISSAHAAHYLTALRQVVADIQDVKEAAIQLGLPPDDPGLKALIASASASFDTAVQSDLPPGLLPQFRDGVEFLAELGELAGSLYDTPTPLTVAQSKGLTELFERLKPQSAQPPDWNGMLQAAPNVLPGAQLPAFRAFIDRLDFQIAVHRAYASSLKSE